MGHPFLGDLRDQKDGQPILYIYSGGLILDLTQPHDWGLGAATDAVSLPQPKPRTVSEHFVVPSIRSREVARPQRSDVRSFEHFLKLLNLVNDAFNVHASQSSKRRRGAVNLKRLLA